MNKITLLVSIVIISSTWASDTFSDAFTKGSIKGNITIFNYNIDTKNEENAYATALGGYLKYNTDEKNPLFASIRFHQSSSIGPDKNKEKTQLFNNDKDGENLTAVSEAFIAYKYKRRIIKGGNLMLKTPMMNDDTTRIVPWSYQGVAFTSDTLEDTTVQVNYITQIRENTSDNYTRESASGKFENGITMLGVTYEGIERLNLQIYYYDAPELYNTFTTQLDHKHIFQDDYLVCLGVQYFKSGDGGKYNTRESRNGGDDIDLLALKVGLDGPSYGLTLNYSQNFGYSGIVKGYGGLAKVYTTSMVANGRGNYKPETWMLKSHYDLDMTFYGQSEFAIWLTHTRVKDSRGDDFNAFYSHLRHYVNNNFSFYLRFESINHLNGHKNDVNYLRLITAYDF